MLAQPVIRGRRLSVHHEGRLNGAVCVEGAKHSFAHVLAVAGAAEHVHVEHAPWQLDAQCLTYVLSQVFETTRVRVDRAMITFSGTRTRDEVVIPHEICTTSRQLYCLLPALLQRATTVVLETAPAGCAIGARPFAWYLEVLRRFGVSVTEAAGALVFRRGRLRATEITFPAPSMTGSVVALAMAMLTPGRSRIVNVSEETSVSDLLQCAKSMGVELTPGPRGSLEIAGGEVPDEVRVRIPPDRVQAVTYLTAAVLAGGRVEVSGSGDLRLGPFLALLRSLGVEVDDRGDRVAVEAPPDPRPGRVLEVFAGPEPRFASDWAPFALLALASAGQPGSSIVDTAFSDRFAFVHSMECMGIGAIALDGRGPAARARIRARLDRPVRGGHVDPPPDIRGTAAVALLGVRARKPLVLSTDLQMRRGYGRFREDLRRLGVEAID